MKIFRDLPKLSQLRLAGSVREPSRSSAVNLAPGLDYLSVDFKSLFRNLPERVV